MEEKIATYKWQSRGVIENEESVARPEWSECN